MRSNPKQSIEWTDGDVHLIFMVYKLEHREDTGISYSSAFLMLICLFVTVNSDFSMVHTFDWQSEQHKGSELKNVLYHVDTSVHFLSHSSTWVLPEICITLGLLHPSQHPYFLHPWLTMVRAYVSDSIIILIHPPIQSVTVMCLKAVLEPLLNGKNWKEKK